MPCTSAPVSPVASQDSRPGTLIAKLSSEASSGPMVRMEKSAGCSVS